MLVDYHIHTFRCGHAVGTVDEYAAAARRQGLREFGFADHLPLYWLPEEKRDPALAMPWSHLPLYMAEVNQARQKNPDLSIKLGLEADFIPGFEQDLREILSSLPLDYVLGSVHFLGDWAFDDPGLIEEYKNHDINELYQTYFNHVQQAAASGLFDIMSHPDLIKKFGFKPTVPLDELYRETVVVFKENDVCVDVNTAGWRYPCAELYPSPEFLKLCLTYGVPVTLGSDAHKPEQVAAGIKEAAALLKEIGFTQVAVFSQRKRSMVDL
ncbi:histidinol phosphate phosphatase HisJ family [Desulfotomaculum nigrificans CO-1-SRB]|uniref:Histidinol-phosphatase n=1 Tax=Desulfotomaculum nigrificans (strain DSM 14880 / VKM B-2319 / CO-1-SRB) TaxID=868595 RepID=F6B3M8_DESCC|nr:histidinol-phosphatase [Desulfotomaculum nigrificans]AEF95187.1 histidinol phosphate phosphatase HisJ family [Desulfotomaculum nigrificans CO-1-SRB]